MMMAGSLAFYADNPEYDGVFGHGELLSIIGGSHLARNVSNETRTHRQEHVPPSHSTG